MVPSAESKAEFGGLFMNGLVSSMIHPLAGSAAHSVSYAGTGTVGGEPAWLLVDSKGDLVYLASHGQPYILQIIAPPAVMDTATLTQWNAAQIPGPPAPGQLVTVSQLTG